MTDGRPGLVLSQVALVVAALAVLFVIIIGIRQPPTLQSTAPPCICSCAFTAPPPVVVAPGTPQP